MAVEIIKQGEEGSGDLVSGWNSNFKFIIQGMAQLKGDISARI